MPNRNLAVTLTCAALLACGPQGQDASAPTQPERGTSRLEDTFEAAAKEFQVPLSVLKAIAWVETRISLNADGSQYGGHGLMNLPRRADWDLLSRAQALLGVDEARLKVDPSANIRGAAAVLRELGDQSFRQYAELDARDVGDWFHAVSLYAGFDSATLARDYAADVFLRIEAGFDQGVGDGNVVQAPLATSWREHAPASSRQDAVAEYPGARWVASPNYSSGRTSYQYVVIHTMQGSYSGCISWFQNPNSNVSSHYTVRSSDGQITQMVEHRNTAWHAQCMNSKSIGIEHEGYVQDPGRWYTDAMYGESAKLTRWIADRHGIPKDRAHILGHVDVPSACNTGGHYDPGSGWNWSRYMSLVTGGTPTASTGVFIGAIYTGGNSANRVAGATVTVNGQSVTTGTDGIYQFTLAPGTYTATVSKSGYGSASISRTITAGAQVWGSMEINTATATGTLRGKVFVFNAANAADMSQPIAGATVTVNGQTQSSGADGMYAFTLAPGTYTVSVAKSGYATNSLSRAVSSGQTVWGSVGLSGSSAADAQPPTVAISFPADLAQLDLAVLTLRGTASDDRGAVASVKVSLNGGAAQDVPVTAGAFQVEVKLRPGTNTLTVTARDVAGNTGKDETKATFNAGVAGFVHVAGEEPARVQGATVELLEQGTGVKVSVATTDAQGAFALSAMTVGQDYLLVTKAPGFRTVSETVTVPDDRRLPWKVGLQAGNDELPSDVALTFTEPAEGAVIPTQSVTVYGAVRGFEVAAVQVNGVQAELLGAGGFTATVPVVEGPNRLEAVAMGVGGETVSASVNVMGRLTTASGPAGGDKLHAAQGGCGCTSGSGFELLALVALAPLLRRRRC